MYKKLLVFKYILLCLFSLQSIASSSATNTDPVPSEFRRAPRISLHKERVPKWAYDTPQHWDSTDIHPLRDLSMLLMVACNDLENKAKDGVPVNKIKMHDAVCALKDGISMPYKDQFKVLDVGFYTLAQAPYIDQTDIKTYLWDKQMVAINRDYVAFPYRLVIAKQFKPNGKYADFRVGLKLPRATTGMFEKMNDAVEEAMQTIVLKTIEDEYKRTNDVMAAETKGVEKLKELLGKIEDLSTMSEEFLKAMGFEEIELTSQVKIRRTGIKNITGSVVKDYAGIEISVDNGNLYQNFRVELETGFNKFMTDFSTISQFCVVTDATNYTTGNAADFNTAKGIFENTTTDINYWIHIIYSTSPTTKTKIFIKGKSNLQEKDVVEYYNEVWKKVREQKVSSFRSGGERSACNFDIASPDWSWRAKDCVLPDLETMLKSDSEKMMYGVGLGVLDSAIDAVVFFASAFSNVAGKINETIGWWASFWKGVKAFGNKIINPKEAFHDLQELVDKIGQYMELAKNIILNVNLNDIVKGIWAWIESEFGTLFGTQGALIAGHEWGKKIGDLLIGYFTGMAGAKLFQAAFN